MSSDGAPRLTELWRRSLGYLRPYWRACLLILLATCVEIAFWSLYPLAVRSLIDNAVTDRDYGRLVDTLAGLGAAFVVLVAAMVVKDRLAADVGARLLGDMRRQLFVHLERLPSAFFGRAELGDVLARFSSDLVAIEAALTRALPLTLFHVVRLPVTLAVLFYLSPALATVALLVLPLAAIGPRLLGGRAAASNYSRRRVEGQLLAFVQEVIAGQAVVRSFGLARLMLDRFESIVAVVRGATARDSFLSRTVATTTTAGVTFGQLTVIGVGALLVFRGDLSPGSLVGFIGVLLTIGVSVEGLSASMPDWLHAAGAMRRVDELLDEPLGVADAPDARPLPRLASDLRLEDVHFAYAPDRPVLRGLSLTIPAGANVALVGPSGSGKSTVLSLLLRFYDPERGALRLDGVDVRQATQESLRAQTGVVFQETYLFSGSIRENIRMARPDATDAEVEAAAGAAQIHDLIVSLPEGYASDVGERGGRLSGGQRQRVAMARAILRDPALLMLDEATSALDPATEAAFNATLATLARGRTVVAVTHRLAGVVSADRIFVLQDGQLAEEGTHAELLARDGLYRRLWEQQGGFTVSPDGRRAEVAAGRLRGVPLFERADEALLEEVASQFATEQCQSGQTIVREGEPGDSFYIVVRGQLDVLHGERLVRTLDDGDFFGEIALIEQSPRTATVRARTPCLLLSLAQEPFWRLLERLPELRAAVQRAAAERTAADRAPAVP
jgi:ATP-binding cassette subfamily B protein